MEDVPEQIHLGLPHGLRREEIVLHEGNPVGDVGGHGVLGAVDHGGEILHDEGEVGVRLREGDADVASGAADVDDGDFVFVFVFAVIVAVVAAGDGRPGVAGC